MRRPTRTPAGHFLGHDDHGLTVAHLRLIDKLLADCCWDGSFLRLVAEMPAECPDLLSALYGPAAGDKPITEAEVEYIRRSSRPGPSRLIDRPERPVRRMVLIAGPGRGGRPVIYTAYGTQATQPSPREWWDTSMKPLETIQAAHFWSEHALAK